VPLYHDRVALATAISFYLVAFPNLAALLEYQDTHLNASEIFFTILISSIPMKTGAI
jgi:hypothetical protein